MKKKSIYIFGAVSSFISVAIEICESEGFTEIFCVDNLNRIKDKSIDGYKVLQLSNMKISDSGRKFICCVHTPSFRQIIVIQALKFGFKPRTMIHSTVSISKRSIISQMAVLISAGAIISPHASVSHFVIINRGALIGHDVSISSFATIESGAMIGGLCSIGEKSYIGMGAIILPKVKIGKNCMVAAGSVVREDVVDNSMVAGVPATVKKENIPGYISS